MKNISYVNKLVIIASALMIFSLNIALIASSNIVSTYVCDDVQCQGYFGLTKGLGTFDHDDEEFSQQDYSKIEILH